MPTMRLLLGCGVCTGLLLGACGKTPEPPGTSAQTLGGKAEGAPLALPRADLGILQDQSTYKPTAFSGGGPGAKPAGPGTVAATDAATAARELVKNLLNDLQDGDIHLVLEALDPEQLGPLADDNDFLFNTQQAYASLTRALGKAAGESSVEQLNGDLRKLVTDKLAIDPVSPDTVTVKPNPLLVIFGPEGTPPAMTVAKKGNAWKVRLEAPLTAADMAAMREYHRKLQEAIYALAEGLDNKTVEGREAVYAGLIQAGLGQEVNLPAATSKPAAEEAPTTAPGEGGTEEGGTPPVPPPPPEPERP